MTVAADWPARTDTNGTTWYRPIMRSAGETWGWTADANQADPSYFDGMDPEVVMAICEGAAVYPSPDITVAGSSRDWPEYHYEIVNAPESGDDPHFTVDGVRTDGPHIRTVTVSLSEPIVQVTTTQEEPMTELAADGTEVDQARVTEWMHYPLPPAPPRLKVTYDGYGRYKLPSPTTGRPTGFTRATTVSSTLEETYNLNRWKRRQAVKAIMAAVDSPQAAQSEQFDTAGADPIGDTLASIREALAADNDRDLDAAIDHLDNLTGGADARELGEAVHAWLEAIDIGTVLPWQVPEMFQPYVIAARDALRRAGLVPISAYVERIVLNDAGEETIVGTIDRIYLCVTTGELIMGDVKTSKTLEYSWLPYSVQVGGVYGCATMILAADGDVEQGKHGWLPMPEVNQDFVVILHVPSDQPERAAVVTLDLCFGGESLIASLDARRRRKNAAKAVPFVHEIPVPSREALRYVEARDALLDLSDADDLGGVWEAYQDVWTDELTELGNHVAELIAAAPATA